MYMELKSLVENLENATTVAEEREIVKQISTILPEVPCNPQERKKIQSILSGTMLAPVPVAKQTVISSLQPILMRY